MAATLIPPHVAPRPEETAPAAGAPTVSFVSLGCPKALVDSERIITRLRAEGYALSRRHEGADVVVVNTCGFLDSAKAESLSAISEALAANGRVIVTGCMGAEPASITDRFPQVLAVTGPQQYEQVVAAVHDAVLPVLADLTAASARFGGYAPRLGNALDRVRAGSTDWFDKPTIDSYHAVWFELHEDLLATLGLDRASESTEE